MATITVDIDQFGNPNIATAGFTGKACEQATESLEAALGKGADNVTNKRTAEYYGRVAQRGTVTTGGAR